jgi:hypothetical protein
MLPELREARTEVNALTREFSSADKVLDLSATVALLRKHTLTIEDVDLSTGEELLR